MVRFVTFVHKDLFPDKYLWPLTWEIHLKILQPTPWEPVSVVEVVNKVGDGAMATKKPKILGSHIRNNRIFQKPINGREISISVFGTTTPTRL